MLIFTNKYVTELKRSVLPYLLLAVLLLSCGKRAGTGDAGGVEWEPAAPEGMQVRQVAIDTMELANPFVIYDRKSDRYYMTGDGGYMWIGDGLRVWNGPYDVIAGNAPSWRSAGSKLTAPEIHWHNGRCYYMASFEDENGTRSCQLLVSDRLIGPYRPVNPGGMTPADGEVPCSPTFFADELNAGYIIYSDCSEPGGALKIMRLTDDLGDRMGEPYTMFSGSTLEAPGARPVDAPHLFITDTGEAGMLFTAYEGEESVVCAAYTRNELGHWLNGPWVPEPQPLVRGNVGGASLFTDFDGTLVMALHKDTLLDGRKAKVPRFVKMEPQFDRLKKIGYYNF